MSIKDQANRNETIPHSLKHDRNSGGLRTWSQPQLPWPSNLKVLVLTLVGSFFLSGWMSVHHH